MGRKPKGTGAPNLVLIREHEVLDWMREVRPPPGEQLLDLLNEARIEHHLVHKGPFARFFRLLAERGRLEGEKTGQDADAPLARALKTLDLVPAFLETLDEPSCAWLRAAISKVFVWRRYDLMTKIPRSRGAPRSDEYVWALVESLQQAGLGRSAAATFVAKARNTSEEAVLNALSRAKDLRRERGERVDATWRRAGIKNRPTSNVRLPLNATPRLKPKP
jgi:hypothetical protein